MVLGVDGQLRLSHRIWEEGDQVPDFVLEVVSPNSAPNDLVTKHSTYEGLGVREHFLCDPWGLNIGGMMRHRLQGEELRGGRYRPMERRADGSLRGDVLGLDLRLRKETGSMNYRELVFRNPRTGKDLETHAAVHASRSEAEERAGRAEEQGRQERLERVRAEGRARAAEDRVAELEEYLQRLRSGRGERVADSGESDGPN